MQMMKLILCECFPYKLCQVSLVFLHKFIQFLYIVDSTMEAVRMPWYMMNNCGGFHPTF